MSLQNDIVSMQIFNFIIIIHNVNGYSVNDMQHSLSCLAPLQENEIQF